MFRASLCPSSGEVVFAWLAGCGSVELGRKQWAHDHSQRNQANTTRSLKQSFSPDDGHNDAQNMLRIF